MRLREEGKARRRRRILRATARLIPREGIEGLSMRKLAAASHLSVTTLYNLFEGKADIVLGLFSDLLDVIAKALDQLEIEDPIQRSRAVITVAIRHFVERPALYRPLMRWTRISAVYRDQPGLFQRSRDLQEAALRAATREGLLTDAVSPRLLAGQIILGCQSALLLWAVGQLGDDGLRLTALHNLNLLLLAAATPASRASILEEVRVLEAGLSVLPRGPGLSGAPRSRRPRGPRSGA